MLPPITPPFVPADGSLALDGLARNAERWGTTGLRGLVLLGSNGEAPLLNETKYDPRLNWSSRAHSKTSACAFATRLRLPTSASV